MLTLNVDDDLRLALLKPWHAEAFFALTDANRAHLRPWLGWVDETRSVEDARTLLRLFQRLDDDGEGYVAGIWWRGTLVGTVDLHDLSRKHAGAGMGYWISATHQGHGLVTRCCHTVLRRAFDEEGLHRVEIRCTPANRRSRAVAERLGFTEEGRLREAYLLHGRHEDLIVYGLLADEWRSGCR